MAKHQIKMTLARDCVSWRGNSVRNFEHTGRAQPAVAGRTFKKPIHGRPCEWVGEQFWADRRSHTGTRQRR